MEEVVFSNSIRECPLGFEKAFASSIFDTSHERRRAFAELYLNAIVGGDGYFPVWRNLTVIGKNMGSNLREIITDCNPEELDAFVRTSNDCPKPGLVLADRHHRSNSLQIQDLPVFRHPVATIDRPYCRQSSAQQDAG